jgi:GNAT superfamily N-acetyltransferase
MIEIRVAELSDADAMCDAHVEGWRVAYRGIVPDWFLDSEPFETERRTNWRNESWRSLEDSLMFAAVLDGRVVGFGHVGPERRDDGAPPRGEVYGFYLHPTAWGSGVASELMAVCEAELRKSGFTEAVLWVFRDNPRGRAFYEKAGWAWTGEESMWERAAVGSSPAFGPIAEVRYRRSL